MKRFVSKKIYKVSYIQLFIFIITILFISCFSVVEASILEKGVNIAVGSASGNLSRYITLYIGFSVVYAASIYLQGIYSSKLIQGVVYDLQNKIYVQVMKMPIEKSERYSEGDYLTLITDDSENTACYLFQGVIPIVGEIIRVVVGFLYLLRTSLLIAFIFALVTIILFLVVRYYSRKVKQTSLSLQEIEGENRNFLLENKRNQEIIRVFNAFETRNIIFERLFNDKSEKKLENAIDNGKSSFFSNLLINLSTIFVVFIGFYLVTIGLINMGNLVGVYVIIGESILYPLLRIPDKIIENSKRKASLIRVNTVLNLPSEIPTKVEPVLNNKQNEDVHFLKLVGSHISFSYDKTIFILTDCNFHLATGEIVSLVGESGCGKTTLISIILSLRKYDSGELYLEKSGENGRVTGNCLRDYFSYVPQENALFSGLTVMENLELGNSNLSTLEMQEICKELNLYDKIQALELQYDTVVDANIPFSIGQLQRLSIARAILSHKPFLILDEPFSALDKNNIKGLQTILTKLSATTGILIVSHQEASIEISGRTYFMNRGVLYEK